MERLSHSAAIQDDRIAALRQEADERNDMQEYLMQAQSEIEGLRQAIESRDEEIERLRMAATANEAPPSLDDEMLSSLRQTHALELSAAQSRIRSLESAIFDAEARAHELQKQVTMLEDQRPAVFTPSPVPSRPSSRGAACHLRAPASLSRISLLRRGISGK
ncbi:hypothetical protein BDZ89DRAFT_1148029 [Hymenopellis radicata]|nr:hypothetical protein BDZ89DRAFT_1148029 [Hymenopellis radicata]